MLDCWFTAAGLRNCRELREESLKVGHGSPEKKVKLDDNTLCCTFKCLSTSETENQLQLLLTRIL